MTNTEKVLHLMAQEIKPLSIMEISNALDLTREQTRTALNSLKRNGRRVESICVYQFGEHARRNWPREQKWCKGWTT